jgi:hypothetical protein
MVKKLIFYYWTLLWRNLFWWLEGAQVTDDLNGWASGDVPSRRYKWTTIHIHFTPDWWNGAQVPPPAAPAPAATTTLEGCDELQSRVGEISNYDLPGKTSFHLPRLMWCRADQIRLDDSAYLNVLKWRQISSTIRSFQLVHVVSDTFMVIGEPTNYSSLWWDQSIKEGWRIGPLS